MVKLNTIECSNNIDYLKKIPEDFVDLVIIDPPYNVSQKSDIRYKDINIIKNFGDWDFGFDPKPVLKELKRILKPNGQIYVFCATKQIPEYMEIFEKEWFFRNMLVWSKTNPAPRLSKTNFVFANEYILYAINEKIKPSLATFHFSKQSEMKNIFITSALQGKERVREKDGRASHPTQKPLSILKKLIEISSNKGDVVLDCFMGSGSTAVACKEIGRHFIGCEINEEYVKIAKERIKKII